jgi:hypothetical protein
VEKAACFLDFSFKSNDLASSLRLKWSLYEVFLMVAFQKARVFSAGGRHGREGKSARQIEYSYHMEVRTLNARRMFREKQRFDCVVKFLIAWLSFHQPTRQRPQQHQNQQQQQQQ